MIITMDEFKTTRLRMIREKAHPRCALCGAANVLGLKMDFRVRGDTSVEAWFPGEVTFEGYPGKLHGGIIAALVDCAMTHCLFAHDREAVTAELTLRYVHAVMAAEALMVRAWLEKSRRSLHQLRAELIQNERTCVRASAKFLDPHD